MYFMSLFKIGCSAVKVHFDMLLTQHVNFHRRLSSEDQRKPTPTFTDVMDNVNQHHMAYHQQQPVEVTLHAGGDGGPPDNINEQVINEIAARMQEIGDKYERERNRARVMEMAEVAAPVAALAFGVAAAVVVYKCCQR